MALKEKTYYVHNSKGKEKKEEINYIHIKELSHLKR
jgi:hypothetical protein